MHWLVRLGQRLPLSWRLALAQSPLAPLLRRYLNRFHPKSRLVIADLAAPLQGHRMRLDWQLYKAFVFGTYEPDVVTVIQRHLRPGMVAVDCGAHIGYHTLLMAKCVGKMGKVYAFEPLPENFSVLCENIALNGYEGIVVAEKKAVGAQTGQQRFRRGQWRPDDLDPLTSVSCLDPQGDLEVEVVALDDYFADRRVDFLKIDQDRCGGGRGNGAGRGAKIAEALDAYFAHQRAWLYTDPSCADDVERDGLSVEGIERVGCGAACFGVGKRERA